MSKKIIIDPDKVIYVSPRYIKEDYSNVKLKNVKTPITIMFTIPEEWVDIIKNTVNQKIKFLENNL